MKDFQRSEVISEFVVAKLALPVLSVFVFPHEINQV